MQRVLGIWAMQHPVGELENVFTAASVDVSL